MSDIASNSSAAPSPVRTFIPARLDRLPWSRFHTMVVIALGVTWILDGLEVTLAGAMGSVLQRPESLGLTSADIGLVGSAYVLGAVIGSLVFGYLTDAYGRRLFFFITLAVYLGGALLTGLSWNLWSFALFRVITGFGIGGEYAAINSAIDELIPARARGQVDITINGSYWIGAAIGSVSTLFFLNDRIFAPDIGWRIAFGTGAVLGLVILIMRRHLPESPRWLETHGYEAQAETVVSGIEREVARMEPERLPALDDGDAITIHPRRRFSIGQILKTMMTTYRDRAILGFALMVAQAFLYNAVFFTYTLVLTRFYHVEASATGLYLLPFAIANVLGVFILGRFFDTIGRRAMITGTYVISAALLVATGALFVGGHLTAVTQTLLWSAIFFFASPAASAAYLTVSEIFPLETRALAIAIFYTIGTAAGGLAAPWLFGTLIGTGSPTALFFGYLAAAGLMVIAAGIEIVCGIKAEGRSLEHIAPPLSTHFDNDVRRSNEVAAE